MIFTFTYLDLYAAHKYNCNFPVGINKVFLLFFCFIFPIRWVDSHPSSLWSLAVVASCLAYSPWENMIKFCYTVPTGITHLACFLLLMVLPKESAVTQLICPVIINLEIDINTHNHWWRSHSSWKTANYYPHILTDRKQLSSGYLYMHSEHHCNTY